MAKMRGGGRTEQRRGDPLRDMLPLAETARLLGESMNSVMRMALRDTLPPHARAWTCAAFLASFL